MKKPKYYTQPDFMGGKKVLSKDVPDKFYSLYFDGEHANSPDEVEFLEHENISCLTKSEMDKKFNTFRTMTQARKAVIQVKKILRSIK